MLHLPKKYSHLTLSTVTWSESNASYTTLSTKQFAHDWFTHVCVDWFHWKRLNNDIIEVLMLPFAHPCAWTRSHFEGNIRNPAPCSYNCTRVYKFLLNPHSAALSLQRNLEDWESNLKQIYSEVILILFRGKEGRCYSWSHVISRTYQDWYLKQETTGKPRRNLRVKNLRDPVLPCCCFNEWPSLWLAAINQLLPPLLPRSHAASRKPQFHQPPSLFVLYGIFSRAWPGSSIPHLILLFLLLIYCLFWPSCQFSFQSDFRRCLK